MANPQGLNKKRNRYFNKCDGLVHVVYRTIGNHDFVQRCNGRIVGAVSDPLAVTCLACLWRE